MGAVICIATLAFVGWVFVAQANRINELGLLRLEIGPLVLSALLYTASLVTTALAWPILVNQEKQVPVDRLVLIGLASQVGKYIPGNIAHYIGRAALARTQEIQVNRSLGTTVVELGTAILAGALVGMFSLATSSAAIRFAARYGTQFVILAGIILAVFFWFTRHERTPLHLLAATMIFGVSFLLAGASFYLAGTAIGGTSDIEPSFAIAAFAFAWIAGFVVLGAPAGLGVREAVLIALLSEAIGAPSALVLSILHRLVTIGMDLLIGASASWLLWRAIGSKDG